MLKIGKFIESQLLVAREYGRWGEERLLMVTEILLGGDRNVLKLDSDDGCTTS